MNNIKNNKEELPISGGQVMARKSKDDEFKLIPSDWVRHHLFCLQ